MCKSSRSQQKSVTEVTNPCNSTHLADCALKKKMAGLPRSHNITFLLMVRKKTEKSETNRFTDSHHMVSENDHRTIEEKE